MDIYQNNIINFVNNSIPIKDKIKTNGLGKI